MSMKSWAKSEMERAQFDEQTKEAMSKILDIFFEEWDSGGAVSWAVPVLERLLKGLPLSPLTGEDDEWNDLSDMAGQQLYQNRRCSTVFKVVDGSRVYCYDIDGPKDPNGYRGMKEITFPYDPENRNLSPVVTI